MLYKVNELVYIFRATMDQVGKMGLGGVFSALGGLGGGKQKKEKANGTEPTPGG